MTCKNLCFKYYTNAPVKHNAATLQCTLLFCMECPDSRSSPLHIIKSLFYNMHQECTGSCGLRGNPWKELEPKQNTIMPNTSCWYWSVCIICTYLCVYALFIVLRAYFFVEIWSSISHAKGVYTSRYAQTNTLHAHS